MNKSEIVNRDSARNLLTPNAKVEVSKSPYAAFDGEEFKPKSSKFKIDQEKIMMHSQSGLLKIREDDSIDIEILKALYELQLATSRMISHYLFIKDININQEKIQKRLVYLLKLKIVSAYEFTSTDAEGKERKLKNSIYYLDEGAKFILKSREIYVNEDKLNAALKSKSQTKEALSRNQTMLNYISTIKNIEFTKIEPIYQIDNDTKLQPDLLIVFKDSSNQNEYYLFEIVRSYENWQARTKEKLFKYREFIESFKPSKTIPKAPQLVLVAEDDVHAFEILKLILAYELMPNNQEYIFSTDNRIIDEKLIDNSLFIFDLKENNEVHLNIIKPHLFIA